MAAVIVVWVVRVERSPLATIGLDRPSWTSVGLRAGAAVAIVARLAVFYAVVLRALQADGRAPMGEVAPTFSPTSRACCCPDVVPRAAWKRE